MIECSNCHQPIPADAKFCQHCGTTVNNQQKTVQPQPKKSSSNCLQALILIIVVSIIGLVIIILKDALVSSIAGSSNRTNPSRNYSSPTQPLIYAKNLVEVTEKSGRSTGYDYAIISGVVKNTGHLPVTFVKLRVIILDANKNQINTDTGYIDSDVLQPGKTSTFEIYVDDPGDFMEYFKVSVDSAYFDE